LEPFEPLAPQLREVGEDVAKVAERRLEVGVGLDDLRHGGVGDAGDLEHAPEPRAPAGRTEDLLRSEAGERGDDAVDGGSQALGRDVLVDRPHEGLAERAQRREDERPQFRRQPLAEEGIERLGGNLRPREAVGGRERGDAVVRNPRLAREEPALLIAQLAERQALEQRRHVSDVTLELGEIVADVERDVVTLVRARVEEHRALEERLVARAPKDAKDEVRTSFLRAAELLALERDLVSPFARVCNALAELCLGAQVFVESTDIEPGNRRPVVAMYKPPYTVRCGRQIALFMRVAHGFLGFRSQIFGHGSLSEIPVFTASCVRIPEQFAPTVEI
jgi:hypothetical protein